MLHVAALSIDPTWAPLLEHPGFQRLLEEYEQFAGAYPAAASLNIEDVIDPRETRPRLIRALELALGRRSEPAHPVMRHGVMP